MRSKVFTMPAALLLLLFFSCNTGGTGNKDVASPATSSATNSSSLSSGAIAADSSSSSNEVGPLYKSADPDRKKAAGNQPHIPVPPQPAANPDWDRKIIKIADLSVEVKNFPAFTDRLHRLVRESGGYIAQEQLSQSGGEIENTVSIKIPVDRFDDLLQQLPADSDRLTEKKVSSQDVGMELVDTKSRLETKRQVRERYRDLLAQSHKMEDILSIQQNIDGIQEEMDAAAGRINYLGHAAALSTVNLKFFQILNPGVVENPPASPGFLHRIKLSVLEGWYYLSNLLLGLLTVWPLWLATATGIVVWRRYQTRVTRKPA